MASAVAAGAVCEQASDPRSPNSVFRTFDDEGLGAAEIDEAQLLQENLERRLAEGAEPVTQADLLAVLRAGY